MSDSAEATQAIWILALYSLHRSYSVATWWLLQLCQALSVFGILRLAGVVLVVVLVLGRCDDEDENEMKYMLAH